MKRKAQPLELPITNFADDWRAALNERAIWGANRSAVSVERSSGRVIVTFCDDPHNMETTEY